MCCRDTIPALCTLHGYFSSPFVIVGFVENMTQCIKKITRTVAFEYRTTEFGIADRKKVEGMNGESVFSTLEDHEDILGITGRHDLSGKATVKVCQVVEPQCSTMTRRVQIKDIKASRVYKKGWKGVVSTEVVGIRSRTSMAIPLNSTAFIPFFHQD